MTDRKVDYSWISILVCAAFYVFNIFGSTAIYDLNDGLAHFVISKYAPLHPELFLDHWGKPIFTLVSSPFAQFGIKGVMILNALLFVFTARIMVLFLRNVNVSFTWAAPILLAFVPVYYQVVMSGLTEVLFAFTTVLAIYLYSKERLLATALIVTWLPFIRSEAYFIVPLFGLAFLLQKNWKAILGLFLGPILMSVFAGIVTGDFLWMINANPYVGASEIYGNGVLMHFADHADHIVGNALAILILIGVAVIFLKGKSNFKSSASSSWLIICFSILFVFIAHSIFWWKGLYGSLGLLRVLATMAPFGVLLAVYVLSRFLTYVNHRISFAVVSLVCASTIYNLFQYQPFLKEPDEFEEMVIELAEWRKNSKHANNPNIWYMYPPIGYYLNIDNFEINDSRQLWHLNHILPSSAVRNGGLIIYDGGRAPNEGKTSREMLFADRHLKLIHQVQSKSGLTEMNGYPFELLVFEKQISKNDTLAKTDFTTNRPILKERLQRIGTDEQGRAYFSMVTFTNYFNAFTFWEEDKESWQADEYEIFVDAAEELDVILHTEYEDGTDYAFELESRTFSIPQENKTVVKRILFVSNPHPETELRVYNWHLVKKTKRQE